MSLSEPVHHGQAERFGGWSWRKPARGEHFRRCSYCGGIHPDDVADELARGASADWADQKYGWPHKFYIQIPNRDPDATFCVGGQHGGDVDREVDEGYIHVAALPPDLRAVALRDG